MFEAQNPVTWPMAGLAEFHVAAGFGCGARKAKGARGRVPKAHCRSSMRGRGCKFRGAVVTLSGAMRKDAPQRPCCSIRAGALRSFLSGAAGMGP